MRGGGKQRARRSARARRGAPGGCAVPRRALRAASLGKCCAAAGVAMRGATGSVAFFSSPFVVWIFFTVSLRVLSASAWS